MGKLTLFEVVKAKKEQKENGIEIECPVANPLWLKFSSLIDINTAKFPDLRDLKLTAIEEYGRVIDESKFVFTDYRLTSRENDSVFIKLRCMDDGDFILLQPFENMAHSEELEEVLDETETSGHFQITDDENNTVDEYVCINNVKSPFEATVRKLVDADRNDKITRTDPVITSRLKYWSFWRYVEKEGTKFEEFLIIEMSKSNGWFTMWKGYFVDPNHVSII